MGSIGARKTQSSPAENERASGPKEIASMTIGEAKRLTQSELENTDLGKLMSYRTRFNEDGTLAYATFEKEEDVPAASINAEDLSGTARQFREWAAEKEPNIKYDSVDIDGNNITAWRPNGDKDFFRVTGGTRKVTNYIEPNNRFGAKDTDGVYVQRTPDRYIRLRFDYVGSKKY